MKKFKQFIEEQEKKKKSGAGEIGTDELVRTYIDDTPGQELDEANIEKAVKYFIDYHRKNKNKKIDRNIWDVARMAGLKYRKLEDAIARHAARKMLPKEIEKDFEPLLRNRKRAQKTTRNLAHVY